VPSTKTTAVPLIIIRYIYLGIYFDSKNIVRDITGDFYDIITHLGRADSSYMKIHAERPTFVLQDRAWPQSEIISSNNVITSLFKIIILETIMV
jgi:hypothetical protein